MSFTAAAQKVSTKGQPKMFAADVQEQLSMHLRTIINGVTVPICTGGTIELKKDPITIHHKPSNERFILELEPRPPSGDGYRQYGDEGTKNRLENQVKSLRSLIEKMPQASFGQGQKTVYDKSIRDALQLQAEDFDVSIPQETLDEIIQKVKCDLQLQTDVTVELYSLNVYQKGGKFVKHKDTPRGDGMLGTLVICLPSLFMGGQFNVSMGDLDFTYFHTGSYSNKGGDEAWWGYDRDSKTLPWCAFYADVDHEIGQVTDGVRITVAYLIRRKDETTKTPIVLPREIEDDEQTAMFRQALGRALGTEDFLPDGGKIGSPCFHMYTNKEIFPGKKESSEALTTKQIKNLKGLDLLIASVASKSFGLDVYLVPYLSHECQLEMADYRLEKFPTKKKCPKFMDDDKVETFFRAKNDKNYDDTPPEDDADIWLLPYSDADCEEVGSTENYNAEGYYGNEASETTFYVQSALFIHVPSYTQSRGQNEENQPPPAKKKKASNAEKKNKGELSA